MPYDPQRHHRRSYRLPGYDYRKPGPYLITLCTQHRRFFLGSILEGEIRRSPAGLMVDTAWRALPNRFPMLTLDAFVVMPDHFHAIVWLRGGTESEKPTASLGRVIGAFKSLTTVAYIRGVAEQRWPAFDRRLWQRGYWERIVRSEIALVRLRRYIEENPRRAERGDHEGRPSVGKGRPSAKG